MQDKNISAGQDLLISTDSKIDDGLRDEKQAIARSRHYTQKAAILTRRDRDKFVFRLGWDGISKAKIVTGCGIKKNSIGKAGKACIASQVAH